MDKLTKLPVGMVNKSMRKKTTRCTPKEILGRIIEILNWDGAGEREKTAMIRELITEWQHS